MTSLARLRFRFGARPASPDVAETLDSTAEQLAPRRALAVHVEGFAGGELERILTLVERRSEENGLLPVILARRVDFAPIRRRGLALELLVDPAAQPVLLGDRLWAERLAGQLRGIARLWRPVELASFAHPADPALVAQLRKVLLEPTRAEREGARLN